MSSQNLETYLQALVHYLDIPLAVDEHGICRLRLKEGLSCQIEVSSTGRFQVTAILGEIAQGSYWDSVLEAALLWNGMNPVSSSSLAFSQRHQSMILQLLLPVEIPEDRLGPCFVEFVEQALAWFDAITTGGPFPGPGIKSQSVFDLQRPKP